MAFLKDLVGRRRLPQLVIAYKQGRTECGKPAVSGDRGSPTARLEALTVMIVTGTS
jgi:hypothetical protein